MSTDQDKGGKYILMEIEPAEGEQGATADLYRPLTKEEAQQKANVQGLFLAILLGSVLLGVSIKIVSSYVEDDLRADLWENVIFSLLTVALSGVMAWALGRIVFRGIRDAHRVRRIFIFVVWVILFLVGIGLGVFK